MAHDVIDLILADHRRFRELFTQLRDDQADRSAALAELSGLLVAHAEAEESDLYPALRQFTGVDTAEVDHGSEEHIEGHEALLDLLEVQPGAEGWNDRVDALIDSVAHHLDEEENTILAESREALSDSQLQELGQLFTQARRALLDAGCGQIEYVRELVKHRTQA